MKVYQTQDIRNIALVGSAKSGKTSLAEAMLFESGQINRLGSIDDKNTVSDYRPIELDKQNSVLSTLLFVEHNSKKINILDTPGFPDYKGEVIAALNVADTAVVTVNAQNGPEIGTERYVNYAKEYGTPVIFVLNHIDHENINFEENLRKMKEEFGEKVTLIQYPVNAGLEFDSVVDVMQMKMFKFPENGGKPEVLDIPDEEKERAEELHQKLVEAAAEGDEELMEKFFEEDTLAEEDIIYGLRLGLKKGDVYPMLITAAKKNKGAARLMDFITNNVPSPDQFSKRSTQDGSKEFTCSPDDPATLFVFKTSIEQHLGEVSYFKVYGGKVAEGQDMISSHKGAKERISQVMAITGKKREKLPEMLPGDIGATIKLKDAHTNSTLYDPKHPAELKKMEFPEPIHVVAIKPVNSSDDEKLGAALNEIHKIDPTMIVEYSRELKQILLKGYGELHINTVKWYLVNQHNIEIEMYSPKIPYRETITKEASSSYRHKKQSGGSGQFGEVHMMIQPYTEGMEEQKVYPIRDQQVYEMEWGGKLVLNNCIVGGSIDAKFFPAILKGLMERMEEGPLTGSYARDIVVNVFDGKMHPVDSNEISFKTAGRNAFSQAFKEAGPKIMEPIYFIEVKVPEAKMGDVMTDLQGRRAIIEGMEGEGKYQYIRAKVPLAEMDRYSTALSSLTSGRAEHSMKFDSYQAVPGDIQQKLLKEYEESQGEEE
ncbi:MAG: elongation factor G [Bacteroidales bacterium]|nr:elongation factor G [Bacteroidales bacterium]